MSALPELQAAMGGALRAGPTPALWALFREPQAVAERRFAAYRRNVIGNWRSALASSYPVLAQLLGQPRFGELADQYIAACPSGNGDLNAYGGELAALLDASALAKALPYLPDIARLEWALFVAYGAADAAEFDLAALSAVPVEAQVALRMPVWVGATLIESPWPVLDIWQAHQGAPDERDALLAGIDLSPSGESRCLLVVRSEGRVFPVALSSAEALFLRTLQANQTLLEAIAAALAADPDFNPGAALQHLFALHVLTGFEESNDE